MTEKKKLTEKFEECLHHILCGSKGIEEYLEERAIACADITLSYTEDRVKELEEQIEKDKDNIEGYAIQVEQLNESNKILKSDLNEADITSNALIQEISALKGKLEVAEKALEHIKSVSKYCPRIISRECYETSREALIQIK